MFNAQTIPCDISNEDIQPSMQTCSVLLNTLPIEWGYCACASERSIVPCMINVIIYHTRLWDSWDFWPIVSETGLEPSSIVK